MSHDWFLLLLFLLLLFDSASTAYGVRRWGWRHEANPLFRRLFEKGSRSQISIAGAAVTTLLISIAWLDEEAAFVFVICFGVVALNNAVAIVRLIRSGAKEASAGEAPSRR